MSKTRGFQDKISGEAGEDLSAAQYLLLTLETDGQYDLADATGDRAVGVLQNAPATAEGSEITLIKGGQTKVVAAATLAVNVVVAPDAAGKAQVAVNGQIPCGIVVKPAGSANDLAVIEFFHTGDDLGGSDEFTNITFAEGGKIIAGTATGLEIGDAANQKIGLWGVTPVVQPSHITDPAAQGAMTATDPAATASVTFSHSWNSSTDPTAAEGAAIIADLDAFKIGVDANNAAIDAAIVDLDALDGAVDNNKTAIDAINVILAASGLTAAS